MIMRPFLQVTKLTTTYRRNGGLKKRRSCHDGGPRARRASALMLSTVWMRVVPLIVVVVVAVHPVSPSVGRNAETMTSNLDLRVSSALELFERSEAAAGEAALLDIAEGYPSYAPAQFFLGLVSHKRGELEPAIEFYAGTLRADPAHADATNNIAAALTILPPADRARVARTLGLMPPVLAEEGELMRRRDDSTAEVTPEPSIIAAADAAAEALFRRAINVDPSHRWARNNLGLHLHSHGLSYEAAAVFSRALELYPQDAEIHYHMGIALQTLGKVQEAARSFMTALGLDPQNVGAALNLATLHHKYGTTKDAVAHYRRAADIIGPGNNDMAVMLRNNLGTALFQMGEHTLAKEEHRAVLTLLDAIDDRISRPDHNDQTDVYVDTLVNMHRARKASCDWHDWERLLHELKRQVDVQQLQAGHPPSLLPFDSLLLSYPVDPAWRRRVAEAHSTRFANTYTTITTTTPDGRTKPYGDDFPEHTSGATETYERMTVSAGEGFTGDTESEDREEGDGHGRVEAEEAVPSDGDGDQNKSVLLEIGFIGHDFDEHPTAHMIEGIFLWQRRLLAEEDRLSREVVDNRGAMSSERGRQAAVEIEEAGRGRGGGGRGGMTESIKRFLESIPTSSTNHCRYSVYSYGGGQSHGDEGNDGSNVASSRARASIQSLVPSFVDLYSAGYADAAARIREKHVDILVDLQGHTLGGRGEIAAAHPAPIQVSYLVFPGTSGARYMDYLLADRHVTPPEHASHYSESLALLPRTYQANLYEDGSTATAAGPALATAPTRDEDRAALRLVHGLPEDLSRIVLANFNKADKLDPESFFLWMQVLRRVPGCVLWLLEPTAGDSERAIIRSRIGDEAEGQGVDRSRIVWAKRVPKSEHLLRHAAADLFVDTLTYGAHSTATDALVGGLPLLTLAGEAFPSRVGVSLLRNAGRHQSALLVAGQREYEDLAVNLVSTMSGRKLLGKLREELRKGRPSTPSWSGEEKKREHSSSKNIDSINTYDHDNEINQRMGERGEERSGRWENGKTAAKRTTARATTPASRRNIAPLFDTEAITLDLNRAFMLMSDVRDEQNTEEALSTVGRRGGGRTGREGGGGSGADGRRFPHIVMTGKKRGLPNF